MTYESANEKAVLLNPRRYVAVLRADVFVANPDAAAEVTRPRRLRRRRPSSRG